MQFNEIRPFVRLAHRFSDKDFIKKEAISTDNRLFYILDGSGTLYINRKPCQVAPGTILLLPRGTSYHLPKIHATLIGINFDYCFNEETAMHLLHPIFENQMRTPISIETKFEDSPALEEPLILHEAENLYPRLKEICDVFEKQKLFHDRICAGLFIVVLSEILLMNTVPQQSKNLVDAVIEYISQNYALPISNNDIGKKFGYHPNYINRLFLKQTGVSMHQYILNYRLSQALTQISCTKLPLTDIAQQCGFGDYAYFSRLFKSKHGTSPTEYRKKSTF